MMDMDLLIADLRMYMAEEIPTGIAHRVLAHAMTERPTGAGARWLVKRAAYIIRQHGDGYREEWSA